jgi:hypothetical protein
LCTGFASIEMIRNSDSWSYGHRKDANQIRRECMQPLDLETYSTALCILVCKNNEWSSLDSANHAVRVGTNQTPVAFNRSGMKAFYNDQDLIPDVAEYSKQICKETGSSVACLVMAAVYCDRAQTNVSNFFGETFLLQAHIRNIVIVALWAVKII